MDTKSLLSIFLHALLLETCTCTKKEELYDRYGLETEKICHLYRKKRTNEISNDNAVIVEPKYKFDRWVVNADLHCRFVFKAPKGDGLFGVIQKMSLRKNDTDCIDYIRFKRKDHHPTEKLCGTLDRASVTALTCASPILLHSMGNYAEYDPSEGKGGELETEIFISKERLREGESLGLSIVYTPYKDCSKTNAEEYGSFGFNSCIRKQYFNDGIFNCVPHVCSDEDCTFSQNEMNEITSSGTGTKVTVAAVTTMILVFITFVICVWVCKKTHRLCWSVEFAGGEACQSQRGQRYQETQPTAPIFEVAVQPSIEDKDLPPRYETLFPDAGREATRDASGDSTSNRDVPSNAETRS